MFSSATAATDFTFTASTAGTFNYFCGVHGFAAQHGSLVVQSTGGGGGGTSGGIDTTLLIGGVVIIVAIVAVVAAIVMRREEPCNSERIEPDAVEKYAERANFAGGEGPTRGPRVFFGLRGALGPWNRDDVSVPLEPGERDLPGRLAMRAADLPKLTDQRVGCPQIRGV